MLSEELQGANDCYSHQETTTCHRATLAVKLKLYICQHKEFQLKRDFFPCEYMIQYTPVK